VELKKEMEEKAKRTSDMVGDGLDRSGKVNIEGLRDGESGLLEVRS